MWFLGPFSVWFGRNLDATVANPDVIRQYDIFFKSALALAFDPVKLPLMPRTDYVISCESSLPKRAAGVIADTAYRTKDSARVT